MTPPPDENKGPLVLGWLWTTTILAITAVTLRMYARITTKSMGWDDYSILLATIITTFGTVVNQIQVNYGFGRHVFYVLDNVANIVKWTIIAELQSYLAVGLVKLSVCWFILRMIKGTHRGLRIAIVALMGVLGIMVVVAELLDGLQCIPLEKAWKPKLQGTCLSTNILTRFTEAIGVVGCITDFACVSIPVFLIRGLNMNRRTKIALVVILSFGVVPGACAIGKSITTDFNTEDSTYDLVPVLIFTGVECNFGIFIASLPALRPLFRNILQNATLRSKASRNILSRADTRNASSRSKSAGTFQTLEDYSDDNQRVPLGKIGVSHTLDITSEPRGSRDDVSMQPYYPGAAV